MRSVHAAIGLLIVVVMFTSCGPQSGSSPGRSGAQAPAPGAAPKRIVAAIRGDPRTMSDAINFAAGGSSSAGVREIEQLLNTGLGILDPKGDLQPGLAEAVPTLDNGLWKLLPDGRME